MYPSWGNYGAPPSQTYGGSGPRKPPMGNQPGQAGGFGSFEASSSSSLFSSLQEQHRQQMEQLQMLHQKQLQSVLHHGNSTPAFGGGLSGGFTGSSWHPEGTGHTEGDGGPVYFKQEKTPVQVMPSVRPGVKQGPQQPPPPAPHQQPTEPQPGPPPPESQPPKPPETIDMSKIPEGFPVVEDKSLPLQEQQQLWYKQHLENLQKLRQEKDKQNQKEGNIVGPLQLSMGQAAPPPPPPSEPPKGAPPPPPPKEEPPMPPPPPVGVKPDAPKDPEEAARLQQLQAAAAQWQQVQQQRVSLQYQALMQQHEKLQQILEQYQRLIQQPPDLQSMSAEMQLRHYEMQQQQFTPLFQDWVGSFALWHDQFQTYPHKDQLQDYEHQWKQWQEQMNATNVHLQERVSTLSAMVPFASIQYSSAMVGQFGQYPGQDIQMQQQAGNPGIQQPPVTVATLPSSQQPPAFVTQSESSAGSPLQGGAPTGVGVKPPVPPTGQPSNFNGVRGQRPSRFDQPPPGFEGPPRFNQPPPGFDGPPRFDQPPPGFDGPPRFDKPLQRFDGPTRFNQPPQGFDGPPRFDPPQQRFDGPPRFNQPRQRFDGPPQIGQPRQRFDGPPRFDQPRQRFNGPPRFDQPRFGQQPRFESSKPIGPPIHLESPATPQQKQQQGPQPKSDTTIQKPVSVDSKTPSKPPEQLQPENEKKESGPKKTNPEDMTDDSLLGSDGFFVQDDPIPQTLSASTKDEKTNIKNASNDSKKATPVTDKPSVTAASAPVSMTPVQNSLKADGPLTDSKPPQIQSPEIHPESHSYDKMQPNTEPPKPPPGRGRGQPPLRGRGRGQMGPGQFRGPNALQAGGEEGEMPYDHMPPEESMGIQEEQEGYQWQDPSYEEFDGDGSQMPPEETWIPEEHYFGEEEYYEEPVGPHMGRGGPPMGRGGPPLGRGGPPLGRGGPPLGRGGPPLGRGGPPLGRGGPPVGRGGPPVGRGGPPMGRGGPPMGRGIPMGRGGPPPMGRGGPLMGRGGPLLGRGGPPMGRGGPPMGRGGPPMGRRGLPIGRSESMEITWEDAEATEYSEEGDPYWGEWRPPMRGMRPPFPPGRGRPPRRHPGFMPPGRGRPHYPLRGEMDHDSISHEMELDDANMDPSMRPMHHGQDQFGHPGHSDIGRGRRTVPPPPHELMDPIEEPLYNEEGEQEWYPPLERGPPMPPHELLDRGGMRRRPMGRGMARGMCRPGINHEEYGEGYEGYNVDFEHREDSYRWRSAPDYPPDDCRHKVEHYESEYNREHTLPERDYGERPPHMPPPEPLRGERWYQEKQRDLPYPYDENNRARGELRIREYRDEPPYRREEPPHPLPLDWDRPSRLPPPPERGYPDYNDRRPRYDEHREEPSTDVPPLPAAPVTDLPVSSSEPTAHGTSGANVLALSQRQHEIILKAAQELKQIRELQVAKTPSTELQSGPSETLPELPAGLLGLEIPPDVRNALKGITAVTLTPATEPLSWDSKSAAADYQSSLSVSKNPPLISKTVDYGHGHEPGTTVERISYGERIVLRPDPVPPDRGYEKELLSLRDPYGRDPYYERRSDPYLDHREYSRERELYREKSLEYERERYERERYHSRERDDRSPLASALRSTYRDRDRERSGSHDPDEHYGRPGYDRPPYERPGLDRVGPERYGSPYMDRRGYPEDRGPHTTAPLAPPPPPPARIEKKPEIKNIEDILKPPGRLTRPERIVIIMRGLPGSGKSHVAKLIRDKEVECGGAPPRVLVLDDYFMTEVEKTEKDPDTGKRVKTKVLEYEYEPEMEDTYRSSMLKTFKKTLDDGFFPFIILDTINDRVKHFDQFWSAAKTKGFEVYVAEITADTQTCAKRNVHGRSLKDIMKMSNNWEPSPRHMVRLDVRSLLQDAAIEEVEMEDFNPEDEPQQPKREEEEESDLGYIPKSKWEMDTSEAKLDKLDGLGSSGKRKREGELSGLEDYLQLPDDYATRTSEPGKKRVRWADLEEKKDAERKRAIGFVVGQTDWEKITDESGQLAQRALNRTKYF